DFARSLRAKGNTDAHVKVTVARVRKVIDGCRFRLIPDLSASRVQEFVGDLRECRKSRVPLEATKEEYTLAEASAILGVKPTTMSAMVARHGLEAKGLGKKRRFPAATVKTLQDRWCSGRAIQTSNFYLAAMKQFCRWLVKDGRMIENPLA